VLVLGIAYGFVCIAARLSYRRVLFPAPLVDVAALPPGARALHGHAADGHPLYGIHWHHPNATKTIVYFHGNGVVVGDEIWMARELFQRGFSVLLVEYRGYGRLRGVEPSEAGLYADADAALAQLANEGVGADQVILWGQSLGTSVAVEMARRGRRAALVLISPYTSIVDLGDFYAPYLPARLILADRFDSIAKAPDVHVPTVVLHGTADEVIPFAMGQRLAHAIAGATLLTAPGRHHGDVFLDEGARFFDDVVSFFRPTGLSSPTPPARRLGWP